jgi:hypothetical protein
MCRDLGWDISNGLRYYRETEAHGLVHREGDLCCLNGEVPAPKKGTASIRESELSRYQLDRPSVLIAKDLPDEEYARFLPSWKAVHKYELALQAASSADIRARVAPYKDALKLKYGMPVRRLKIARKPPPEMPQMLLEFLESPSLESEKQTLDTSGSRFLKRPPSLLCSKGLIGTTITAAAAITDEVRSISEALEIDAAAAASIFHEARKLEDSITAAEVVELGRQKLEQIEPQRKNGTITSWVGILKTSVPQMAVGGPLVAARRAIRDRAEQEAYQRSIEEASAKAVAEGDAAEPVHREAIDKEQQQEDPATVERARKLEREMAERRLAEDKKYFEKILADPRKTIHHHLLGKQRFYTDEQIAEAEQWRREHPEGNAARA